MDNQTFAQLMSRNCVPQVAALVLRVTAKHADDAMQHKLISALTHCSQMARIQQGTEAFDMIVQVAERLFDEASLQCFGIQENSAWAIVRTASHAAGMARIVQEGTDEIYGTIRPMIDEPLPTNQALERRLNDRLEAACTQIRGITHRIQIERLLR